MQTTPSPSPRPSRKSMSMCVDGDGEDVEEWEQEEEEESGFGDEEEAVIQLDDDEDEEDEENGNNDGDLADHDGDDGRSGAAERAGDNNTTQAQPPFSPTRSAASAASASHPLSPAPPTSPHPHPHPHSPAAASAQAAASSAATAAAPSIATAATMPSSSSNNSTDTTSASSSARSPPPPPPVVDRDRSYAIAVKRLLSDARQMENDPPDGVSGAPLDPHAPFVWRCAIFGPSDTAWEGGVFQLQMQFGVDYPQKPPVVRFISKIFHPNVFVDGHLCLDIIQDKWSPVYSVSTILTSIQSLLSDPNTASPANPEAAKLYASDQKEYRKKVRACVEKSTENA